MTKINIKIYNPNTGKRIVYLPPIPLGFIASALKITAKFSKNKNMDIPNFNLSKTDLKFLVSELKNCSPIELVKVSKGGKPIVNISIT